MSKMKLLIESLQWVAVLAGMLFAAYLFHVQGKPAYCLGTLGIAIAIFLGKFLEGD